MIKKKYSTSKTQDILGLLYCICDFLYIPITVLSPIIQAAIPIFFSHRIYPIYVFRFTSLIHVI